MRIALGLALACAPLGAQALAASPKPPGPKPVTVKACTPAQAGEWKHVREEQLGVEARARSGAAWIGLTAATDGFHDWAPFDDYKTTICGQLAIFDTFEPTREKKLLQFLPEIPEHDWNIILIPTRNTIFDERFKLAAKLMDRGHEGDLELCFDRSNPCFEAEITPPRGLLRANTAGRWLSACRRGQTVCVFGPWVGDGGHGYRPEIHPAERIWWRDGDRMRLVFAQDASQRFGDRRQFQWKWGQREPSIWHPWATPGLEGEFRLAFEATKGSTVAFGIDQLLEANTRHVPHPVPSAKLSFPLEEGGVGVGSVEVSLGLGSKSDRLELDLSTLDVGPLEVCDRGDGKLQGYLIIGDKAGYRYQEGEGFDAFEVRPPPFLTRDESSEEGHASAESAPAQELLHASARISAREDDINEARAESVSRLLGDLLDAATDKPPAPGAPAGQSVEQAQAVQRMTTQRPDLAVGFARRFRLSARPHYDGPRGERIESAIDKARRGDLRDLLAAAPAPLPERVAWTVRVQDFTNRERIPGRVLLTCKQRLLIDDDCVLDLPASGDGGPPEDVLRVTVTASILDDRGDPIPERNVVGGGGVVMGADGGPTAQQDIRLSSHFIRASKSDSAEKVLRWLSAANPAGRELLRLARSRDEAWPDQSDLDPYRRLYYARMLRHGVALATADGRITLDEISQFVDMTQAFGNLPSLRRLPPPPTVK